MNLKQPRRKLGSFKPNLNPPLPSAKNSKGECETFHGRFNGFAVLIEDKEEQERIHSMGFFGKGNLSRSFPNFTPKESSKMIRQRQFDNRQLLKEKFKMQRSCVQEKVLVVPDSDSDEEYFVDIKAKYELDRCNLREFLQLSLCEAYFLMCYIGCLEITDCRKIIAKENCWEMFCGADELFVQNYAVYHYFKSKNWVVKPGIKFGVDFRKSFCVKSRISV